MNATVSLMMWVVLALPLGAASPPEAVWPGGAPGEIGRSTGIAQPIRPEEVPPVTRVEQVEAPTFTVHLAPDAIRSRAGVIILPGGGFSKVVPDKEGTEAADWLNGLGISAFVLTYRTTHPTTADAPGWPRPLQDAQRTVSLIRSRADAYGLRPDQIGILGFSAGGQVVARLLAADGKRAYGRIDGVDDASCRPDFALLIYPWNAYDPKLDGLAEGITVPAGCPPVFLVHTDDDRSSSLGAVLFYAGLKRRGIPAELHVYGNGGHGYGVRPVEGSEIASWTGHAGHWLGRWLAGR